jgi:hypothetical protein
MPSTPVILPDNICEQLAEILATAAADDLIPIRVWANTPGGGRDNITDWNNAFLAARVHPDREIFYFSNFTSTFGIEATPAEILYLAGLDEVSDLSFYEELTVFPAEE